MVLVPIWDNAGVEVVWPCFQVDFVVDYSFMEPIIPLAWDLKAHLLELEYTKSKY
jgi:hypothetical protein